MSIGGEDFLVADWGKQVNTGAGNTIKFCFVTITHCRKLLDFVWTYLGLIILQVQQICMTSGVKWARINLVLSLG